RAAAFGLSSLMLQSLRSISNKYIAPVSSRPAPRLPPACPSAIDPRRRSPDREETFRFVFAPAPVGRGQEIRRRRAGSGWPPKRWHVHPKDQHKEKLESRS